MTPDPYKVVPCPHEPVVPKQISSQCALSTKKRSCKQAVYCEAHLCGACKKAGNSGLDTANMAERLQRPVTPGGSWKDE